MTKAAATRLRNEAFAMLEHEATRGPTHMFLFRLYALLLTPGEVLPPLMAKRDELVEKAYTQTRQWQEDTRSYD